MSDSTKTTATIGYFLEKTPKYANRVDIWRRKRYDAPNFSKLQRGGKQHEASQHRHDDVPDVHGYDVHVHVSARPK